MGVKRVETLVSTLLPRRGARRIPALRRAQLLAESQRKTLRPSGANTLTQFASPAQPVPKKTAARKGANTPTAVRAPRSAGAEKDCRPERGEHACAVRAPHSVGAEKRLPPRKDVALRASCTPERRWFLKIKRKTTHFREWFSWWKLQGSNL